MATYKYVINPHTGKLQKVLDDTNLGDMKKSDYDTNDDGVVDNSEKLEGSTKSEVQDHEPKDHDHLEEDITDLDHNAQKIKGIEVDDTDIDDGKILKYNSTSGKLEYEDESEADGGYDLVTVGIAGADYDNFDDAIDCLREKNGGIIIVISDMTITSTAIKDISNIIIQGDTFYAGTRKINKTVNGGYWYGQNICVKNIQFLRMSDTGANEIFRFTADYQNLNLEWVSCIGFGAPFNSPKVFNLNGFEGHILTRGNTLLGAEAADWHPFLNPATLVLHIYDRTGFYGASDTFDACFMTDSTVIEGTPTFTSPGHPVRINKASGMDNDSSVSGDTVKDALENLDSDITSLEARAKVYTFNLPTTSIANGESMQIHRFTVPSGLDVKVWAAGLASEEGTSVAGAKIQIYNETDSQEEYSTNSTFVQGEPIDTLELAGKDIAIKVLNDSGLAGDFNGFISITLE